jgi:DNA-binding winged helix-turn-helix (wHTH) protein
MIRIGHLDVSLSTRSIRVGGAQVRLGSRAFDILELLIRAQGGVVTLDHITKTIWPRTVVVENNIRVHIAAIRKLLGSDRDLLVTSPGRGYRLAQPEMYSVDLRRAQSMPVQPSFGRADPLEEATTLFPRVPRTAKWESPSDRQDEPPRESWRLVGLS